MKETNSKKEAEKIGEPARLKELDHQCIAGTYARYDVVIDRGQGATCWDLAGKEYIDFTSGIGVNALGFADPAWAKAIGEQAAKLQHCSNLFYTEPMVRLARALTARTGMSKVFFANSGAEANECAIKAARKSGNGASENHRNRIITLEEAFHGRTMATITATGQEHYHRDFYPFVDGFDYAPINDEKALEDMITEETCAILMELIQGEGGVREVEPTFARKVEELCRQHDLLLIIDEVQTGIGRTGTLFCYEQYGLAPNMVTFAKGIGGGLPLGGVLFDEKTAGILSPGDHGTTFGGNPVATAGANVVMERMDEDFLKDVREKGELIRNRLETIPGVTEISGRGMMLGFRVEGREAADVVTAAQGEGLLLLTAKDKVRMLPPLSIAEEEVKKGLAILEKVIALERKV